MAVQGAKEQNIFGNSSTSGSEWVMIDGMAYKKQTDERGDFIVKGGTEKIYLSDYYAKQSTDAKTARLQQEITAYFSGTIDDFDNMAKDYAKKIKKYNEEIALFEQDIAENNVVVAENTTLLKPLWEKYNTTDVREFKGHDKTNGTKWTNAKKTAAKVISDADLRINTRKKIFIPDLLKLMSHAQFCGAMVEKIASATLRNIS